MKKKNAAPSVSRQSFNDISGKWRNLAALFLVWAVIASALCYIQNKNLYGRIRELTEDRSRLKQELESSRRQRISALPRNIEPAPSPATSPPQVAGRPTPSNPVRQTKQPDPRETSASNEDEFDTSEPAEAPPTTPAARKTDPADAKDGTLQEIAQAKKIYDNELLKIGQAHEGSAAALNSSYKNALAEILKQVQNRGDLDGVLTVKNEIDRSAAEGALPAVPAESPKELKDLQLACGQKVAALEQARRLSFDKLRQQYSQHLETLEKTFTRQGNLEKALKVREEKERFTAEKAAEEPAENAEGN